MSRSSPLGIVLAGGKGSRLQPCTLAINKQLLPIYDKPLIFYPISVLLLNDIKRIVIICNEENLAQYQRVLGTGNHLGCEFTYRIQPFPEGLPQAFTLCADLIEEAGCYLILGDNIFHGSDIVHKVKKIKTDRATIFTKNVKNPSAFGVVKRTDGQIIDLIEKPKRYISSEAILGLYYFPQCVTNRANKLQKSARNEYEITDLIKTYLEDGLLSSTIFGRGTAWFDTGTFDSMLTASNYVRTLQEDQNSQVGNLEEIALSKQWVDSETVLERCGKMGKSSYYQTIIHNYSK